MKNEKLKKILKGAWEISKIVVFAFLLSIFIRGYVAEAREIPTGSMIPTIKIGDIILVEKISCRFKYVNRGDIVVFTPPAAAHAKDDYVKRVIGLPGEIVEIRAGKVYINDEPIKEDYILEEPTDDYGPVRVPKGAFFVMGDNRNNSSDSRVWGFVPAKNIKGKALLRYYPFDRFAFFPDNQ